MSLTLAYCENFRRSLWGLKNNQTRKERFFRWFLTFVVIKSNLDVFALASSAHQTPVASKITQAEF
ncbi:hypothetical protein [Nostoc sp.]|uniref:hypothetical protein n=1 Tax=Nostoc sp. TaxID=1180 RepID=UPI002FF57FC2